MIEPRPEVHLLTEALHGSANDSELAGFGIDPRQVLDFSASLNPLGPSPRVAEALAHANIGSYPDRDTTELRQALASHLHVPSECLIAGNGSSELLYLIALAYFRPADRVLIVGPTYSEYARVAALMGASIRECAATVESDFAFPAAQVSQSLIRLKPRAVFLCHPNNPTGQCASVADIREWIDQYPQTMFIVDEAYLEFSPGAVSLIGDQHDNLIVLRSLTKAYGLAGLRLGYAVSSPEVIKVLGRVRQPWSVNTYAQAAGIVALHDAAHVKESLQLLMAEKQSLLTELSNSGFVICPSAAHFFLVRVENATRARRELLEDGILVRDCTSFGLPEWIRISPQSSEANRILCDAIHNRLKPQPAKSPDNLRSINAFR